MKKRLFVLAGLVLAILAIGIVSLVVKAQKKTTCEAFIFAVEKGDATGTYNTFTDRSKNLITAKAWEDQVSLLQVVYGNQKPTALSELSPITDPTAGEIGSYTRDYLVQLDKAKYQITCTTTVAEPGKVDSFSSRIMF